MELDLHLSLSLAADTLLNLSGPQFLTCLVEPSYLDDCMAVKVTGDGRGPTVVLVVARPGRGLVLVVGMGGW